MKENKVFNVIGLMILIFFMPPAYAQSDASTPAASSSSSEAVKTKDHALARKVRQALGKEKQLDILHVYVKASQSVITLTGYCPSQQQVERAGNIAAAIPGVVAVSNRLAVRDPSENSNRRIGGVTGF